MTYRAIGIVLRAACVLVSGLPCPASAQATSALHLLCGYADQSDLTAVDVFGTRATSQASCVAGPASTSTTANNRTVTTTGRARQPGGDRPSVASANSINADVLYLDVPGASDSQTTDIQFSWTLTGSVSDLTGAGVIVAFQAGYAVPSSCVFPVDNAQLQLPDGENVEAKELYFQAAGEATTPYVRRMTVRIVGPRAVVPIATCLSSLASSTHVVDGWAASQASLTAAVKLALPAGVICHSRSGVAFNGQCAPQGD